MSVVLFAMSAERNQYRRNRAKYKCPRCVTSITIFWSTINEFVAHNVDMAKIILIDTIMTT